MRAIAFVLCLLFAGSAYADWIEIDADRTSGPKGDSSSSGGGTDDTTTINSYFSAASAGDTIVLGATRSGRYYRIDSTLNCPAGVSFLCFGTLVTADTDNQVMFSGGGGSGAADGLRFRVPVMKATATNWSSESSCGVQISNPQNCEISIPLAKNFTLGAQILSSVGAFNNNIYLGNVAENKVGLDLRSTDVNGAIYNNRVVGGRFKVTSGVNDGSSRWGVRISDASSSNETPVNNVIQNGYYDLNNTKASPGAATSLLIESDNAAYNSLIRPTLVDTLVGSATGSAPTYNAIKTREGIATAIGSKTHDFASLATAASETTTVTAPGAVVGDYVLVSLSTLTQSGMQLTGSVSSSDTVSVTLSNNGGTNPTNVSSGTLSVQVIHP